MDYASWADRTAEICRRCLENPLPLGIFLNVNFPAGSKGTASPG
jgi:broad specificity polyphosphatase/5'/3'-nucleotidase SurE